MSLNILIDTIFVGQWIGPLAIAVVTVVFPITFLISSLGMAIGVGGGSVLSRALGAKRKKAKLLLPIKL
jgi:Na+-driven multidrug efflux pump